jgi:tetratricopeptide (TPR) repeat protein
MDWIVLLERVEPYYQWRREQHPPYPDLTLEWGLYALLRGQLLLETDPRTAESLLAAAAEARATLGARAAGFEDRQVWEHWLTAQGGLRPTAPAPAAEAIDAVFRQAFAGAADEGEALLAAVAPLTGEPAAARRALLCPAFRRLFAAMGEFFTYRAEAEAGRRLYAWAALCGRQADRHWLYRARWERRVGEAKTAVALLEEGCRRWPQSIELLRELAAARDRQGELAAAVALLERAVALQPDWPDLRYELARLLQEGEHREASLLQLSKALELNPSYARAALGRAELLVAMGELSAAEQQLERLPEGKGEVAQVYTLLSRIYAERRDARRAEEFGVLAQQAKEREAGSR